MARRGSRNITEKDRRRFDIITREVGCIPCRIRFGVGYMAAQANHLLRGYRIGHHATVPECPWHHVGECWTGIDSRAMRKTFGPSRKLHKRAFRREFGTDEELLKLTNQHVAEFEAKIIGGGNHENTTHAGPSPGGNEKAL